MSLSWWNPSPRRSSDQPAEHVRDLRRLDRNHPVHQIMGPREERSVVSDQRQRTAPDIDLSSSASFEDVVEAESGRIFAALRLVAGDRREAETLMLDAFMDVWDR